MCFIKVLFLFPLSTIVSCRTANMDYLLLAQLKSICNRFARVRSEGLLEQLQVIIFIGGEYLVNLFTCRQEQSANPWKQVVQL